MARPIRVSSWVLLLLLISPAARADDQSPNDEAHRRGRSAESRHREQEAERRGNHEKEAPEDRGRAAEKEAAREKEVEREKDEIRLWPCEKKLIELTNAERARHGLAPLTLEKGLLDSARTHCYWMAGAHSLQHTTAAVAENIAMGQASCAEAVADWMRSPGHRANMLGGYSRIGAAAYTASDGRIYWCLQFLR